MDRQYEYVFAGGSDHHGFVSHHSGERIDPVVKKGIEGWRIADGRLQLKRKGYQETGVSGSKISGYQGIRKV